MTPEGEFRDPAPPRQATWLDRLLLRIGGAAALAALLAAGIVVAGVAVAAFALALPVALLAGVIAFCTLWWRVRRGGTVVGKNFSFTVTRR